MVEIPAGDDPARNWRLLNTSFSYFGLFKDIPVIVFTLIPRGQQIGRQLPWKRWSVAHSSQEEGTATPHRATGRSTRAGEEAEE